MVGIQWPHKRSNKKLYKITKSEPISKTIRLLAKCPARKAMQYYFEHRTSKKYLGRKRTTIVTTINKDIKQANEKYTNFPVKLLISQVSLQNIKTKAKNRKLWTEIVKTVVILGLFLKIENKQLNVYVMIGRRKSEEEGGEGGDILVTY